MRSDDLCLVIKTSTGDSLQLNPTFGAGPTSIWDGKSSDLFTEIAAAAQIISIVNLVHGWMLTGGPLTVIYRLERSPLEWDFLVSAAHRVHSVILLTWQSEVADLHDLLGGYQAVPRCHVPERERKHEELLLSYHLVDWRFGENAHIVTSGFYRRPIYQTTLPEDQGRRMQPPCHVNWARCTLWRHKNSE